MGSLAPLRQGFEERSSDFTREVESVLVKGNSLEETLLTLCVSCIQISNTEKKKKKKVQTSSVEFRIKWWKHQRLRG